MPGPRVYAKHVNSRFGSVICASFDEKDSELRLSIHLSRRQECLLFIWVSSKYPQYPCEDKGPPRHYDVFGVLIIVMRLVCDCLVTLRRELSRPIFLEGIFGLTQLFLFQNICHFIQKMRHQYSDSEHFCDDHAQCFCTYQFFSIAGDEAISRLSSVNSDLYSHSTHSKQQTLL
jgi:hypothetical protein